MRKYSFLFTLLLLSASSFAQNKDFSYKFYGQVRTDLYYNSRANEETVDGLFYMYPKDKIYDTDGKDLNATANGSFYTLYTRLGVDVAPQILNLNMGAPFQPFSRAPQIRFRYKTGDIQLTGAAIWQSQYLSQGPDGKSQKYIKESCIPEVYIGADYKGNNWLVGAGIEMVSLKPRTQSVVEDKVYKVDERITSLSYEVHMKYTSPVWYIAAKSILGSNLTQVSMLGGYGIKSIDQRTGEQEYSPNRNSSSWLNIVYGKKWKPAVFFGYMKNLGTSDEVTKMYGTGTNVDQLISASAELTYNVPHWKIGVEYNFSSAWYGSLDKSDGTIIDTHSVSNNRLVATVLFMF